MQIIRNFLYNAIYQLFILIVPLVTTPYLSRVLGPSGVGINSYTNSIIQYFILFGSVGIDLYGNRQIAFVRNDKAKMSKTFYELFILRILTICLAYLVFVIFLIFIGKYRVYYLIQSISIIAAAFDISWFFMGVENFGITVLRNFVVKVITLASIFLFVKSYNNLNIYILIISLSILFGNLTFFPSLHKYLEQVEFRKLRPLKHLKQSLILFVPQVAVQIYWVLNKTMLGILDSVKSAGFFDQSDKIVKIVLAIVTATGTVMLPHVANAFARGEYHKTKEYLYISFSFVSAISIPMMFGLIAITPKFVPLFFTSQFSNVIPILMIESIVIILIAWSNAIGTQYLLPTNQNKPYTISVMIGAIVNLILNVPLIMYLGTVGASIATVFSETSVIAYQLFAIRHQVSFNKMFFESFKYLISGLVMFLIVFEINRKTPRTWLFIGVEIISGTIIYLLLLLILRAEIVKRIKTIICK
ncbi:polysaccharide biosynthesis C-terminal domain-containing protein (plasmid) [Lactiplantibacillus plantarum]|uniref:oligosaccharide flippase family protein n=1 Tax=Lactiplantibacillus plantarum TaxID=1590 RepID=UPI00200DDBFC|nr:polysaccharide biosynthesis C-terminal domain-containing protein [Lactiplantibacillus plantarum]UQB62625.1 polysaccharide biosynthesis C-terminal domain-containing protein [Lactiplantibacillus plantarum]